MRIIEAIAWIVSFIGLSVGMGLMLFGMMTRS